MYKELDLAHFRDYTSYHSLHPVPLQRSGLGWGKVGQMLTAITWSLFPLNSWLKLCWLSIQ